MTTDKISYDLSGDLIVLTGANGRLGRYYSKLLTKHGAKVVGLDVGISGDEMKAADAAGISLINCNISSKDAVKDVFNRVKSEWGLVSGLINNAAAGQTTFVEGDLVSFEEFPLELWIENLEVNLTGAFLCCQQAGKHMLERGKGVILNVSSTYGMVACDQRIYGASGLNSNCAYAATKSGVLNFTRYLASYWQGKNIRVNNLIPGGIYNNQDDEFFKNYINKTMIKRMGRNEDLGAAVLYLMSDASSWTTGADHVVDGGFTAW